MGGGLRGGSADSARGKTSSVGASEALAGICGSAKLATGATVAIHVLRHAAAPRSPSGQQGQGDESSTGGIESAQGMGALAPVLTDREATTGADMNTCPATSK